MPSKHRGERLPVSDRVGTTLALALTARAPSTSCPPAEQLAALQQGLLDQHEQTPVHEHLAHCESCYAVVLDLLEMDAAQSTSSPAARRHPLRRFKWWLAAGLVSTALAIMLWLPLFEVVYPAYDLALSVQTRTTRSGDQEMLTVERGVFGPGAVFLLLVRLHTSTDLVSDYRVVVVPSCTAPA